MRYALPIHGWQVPYLPYYQEGSRVGSSCYSYSVLVLVPYKPVLACTGFLFISIINIRIDIRSLQLQVPYLCLVRTVTQGNVQVQCLRQHRPAMQARGGSPLNNHRAKLSRV